MKRYTIAICENEDVQALYVKKIVEDYANEKGLLFDIVLYESAEAFLFEYTENKEVDIILLDIQMSEMDGLVMADTLRERHDQVKIIFITGMTEHIGAGYRVAASDYLIKPIKKDQLNAVLTRVLKELPEEEEYLILPVNDEQIKITTTDIVCAEVSGRQLFLTTTTETYELRLTMQELTKQLDAKQFTPTARGWLVNCAHIERITKQEVILDNQMPAPLSRRNTKAVTQAFIQYYRKG